jgi:hypothetical protein
MSSNCLVPEILAACIKKICNFQQKAEKIAVSET